MPPSNDLGDATLREALDRLEKKHGIKASKQEYARRASTGVSALNGGMVAHAKAEVTTRHPFAVALAMMTLRQRWDALDKHYAARQPWTQARSRRPTPEEFLAWLDKNFPDRREIGLALSDLNHLDRLGYQKVSGWSGLSKATIESFGLPSRFVKYDPERDADAPDTWGEARARAAAGEDRVKNLTRAYRRADYHRRPRIPFSRYQLQVLEEILSAEIVRAGGVADDAPLKICVADGLLKKVRDEGARLKARSEALRSQKYRVGSLECR